MYYSILLYTQGENTYLIPALWAIGVALFLFMFISIFVQRRAGVRLKNELEELEKVKQDNVEYEFVLKAMRLCTWHIDVPSQMLTIDADYHDDKGDFVCAYTDYNIVLAKEVYLALDTKLHRLNLNTLVIGGSGSGKTLFWVITNILQLNPSFVITDPKGEIYQATAKLLQEAGYEVRVFNTIQMEHSHNYNPFHYIKFTGCKVNSISAKNTLFYC